MDKTNEFLAAVTARRSNYTLTGQSPISAAQIEQIVRECVKQAPSAFNSQSARVAVLFGKEHRALWQLTEDALRDVVPADKFVPTQEKIASFAKAFGTILYFEEWKSVEDLQAKFPAYKDNFPLWAYQSNGMLEFMVWTALAEAGVGASLQHYNPLIDARVQATFHTPSSWKLIAQMPFGQPSEPPQPKDFLPLDERVKVFGKK